jgi:hypothetical protein
VVEKIIAFEVEGRIQHFIGNYSDYMEYLQKQPVERLTNYPLSTQRRFSQYHIFAVARAAKSSTGFVF